MGCSVIPSRRRAQCSAGRMMGFAQADLSLVEDGRSGSIRGLDHAGSARRSTKVGGHDLHGLAADRHDQGCHAGTAAAASCGLCSARTW
jgi:hypothetical protein